MTADYAVVDLETTGTQLHANHRIIQFGCALISQRKITESISLTINPARPVPPEIIELTHLKPQKLAQSPTFAEVAPTLRQLLAKRTFVAHNVDFDFPFINAEFQRCGLPPLQVSAIDTVELAQIMLPQAPSYRLSDLSAYLNIHHKHPHQADSDALATAKILLLLQKRIAQLPRLTQTQLAQLGQTLSHQTGKLFSNQSLSSTLPDHLIEVHDFILRRPLSLTMSTRNPIAPYPQTDEKKRQQWGASLKMRPVQFQMMDFLTQQLTNKTTKRLVVEAPTGIGKTLGYLLPLSYELDRHSQRRLVITVPTTLLQHQLQRQTLPLLNTVRKKDFSAAVLKSARHYLDLDRFRTYLQKGPQNRHTIINEMRILVWLTQTLTGDLDELQLTRYNTMFYNSINHLPQIVAQSPYAEVDFWQRVQTAARQADIVITNNAYLAQHLNDFDTKQDMLVVDEAQHFADDLTQSSHHAFSIQRLSEQAKQLNDIVHFMIDNPEAQAELTQNQRFLSSVHRCLDRYQKALQALNDQLVLLVGNQLLTEPKYLDFQTQATQRSQLQTALIHVIDCQDTYLDQCLPLEDKLTSAQSQLMTQQRIQTWQQKNNDLEQKQKQLLQAKEKLADPHFREFGFFLDLDDDGVNYRFNWLAKTHQKLRQDLDQHFSFQLYTGAALAVGTDFTYFRQQLGFSQTETKTLQLSSPFAYGRRAALLAPQSTQTPNQNGADYDRWLFKVMLPILRNNHVQTLVLFNSLASVRNVYRLLQPALGQQREILAQGITGSNDKIAKRFRFTKAGILLGSQSFWEGIDFPNAELSLLLITRIPFESPRNPATHYRQIRLTQRGESAFNVDTLPRAILKLKQGFGRLIRNENDRGVVVMLDERARKSHYQKAIQQAFPPQLLPEVLPNDQLSVFIANFFKRVGL